MAARRLLDPTRGLSSVSAGRLQPFLSRSMATTTSSSPISDSSLSSRSVEATYTQPPPHSTAGPATATISRPAPPPANPFLSTALTTLYSFPDLEPKTVVHYPSTHLLVPLRKDILHRAVVFEGDATRQGTASTKWRSEVHGSNRKVRPQKGTGKARLGDKKSPMLKGGGVAFGPKPRDFSTDLPRAIYDLAWRVALSYRYRRGQLIVVEDALEIERQGPGSARWMRELLNWQGWGNKDGRSLFVTRHVRPNLVEALDAPGMGKEARVLQVEEVDVKDLLEMGRVVIERRALDYVLGKHVSDLKGAKVTYEASS
ncbi:hypothetical protein AAFC00_003406 [Neodothiora populina]|uniref:Large ribosomal subunit protein uL4m n=1 Tax=Neodothiora populina TaxID=2781224 RepID=A0ABR3PE25_9PEZI